MCDNSKVKQSEIKAEFVADCHYIRHRYKFLEIIDDYEKVTGKTCPKKWSVKIRREIEEKRSAMRSKYGHDHQQEYEFLADIEG